MRTRTVVRFFNLWVLVIAAVLCVLKQLPVLVFSSTAATRRGVLERGNFQLRIPHRSSRQHGHYIPRLAAFGGGGDDYDDLQSPKPAGGGVSPVPLPSLSQILSVWVVGVSGNRIVRSLFFGDSENITGGTLDTKMAMNIALNLSIFVGACFFLIKTIQGIDYPSLEDLDKKSLAKQAGLWALEGQVPTSLEVVSNDDGGNDDGKTCSYEVATFAGGCFWGTELHFQRIPGVFATCVGYTQGFVEKPTYEQVCSGTTGHTEGIQLVFDPSECSYERLLNQLFDTIDPTLKNRVGNDSGTQYRHGVYPHTREQQAVADSFFKTLQAKYEARGETIVTELKPATIFWPAENYHQRHLEKGGQSAEKNCEEKVRCYG